MKVLCGCNSIRVAVEYAEVANEYNNNINLPNTYSLVANYFDLV